MGKSAAEIEGEIRDKLRRDCRLLARGMWHELRCVIETESDRPGHLQKRGRPFSAEQLAKRAGCSADEVAPLLQALVLAELLVLTDAGVYYSPELQSLLEIRADGRRRAKACRDRTKVLRAPDVTPNVRETCAGRAQSARPPPDESPSPPLTPPLTPPHPPKGAAPPVPAEPAKAGKPAAGKGGGKRRRTDEDHRIFHEVRRWWCDECWPLEHGAEVYDWEGTEERRKLNYRALWNILDALVWNVDHVKQAMAYFSWWCAGNFARFSVPLEQLVRFRRKDTKEWLKDAQVYGTGGNLKIGGSAAARSNGNGTNSGIYVRGVYKPSAAERGEFPEPDEPLPEFGRDDDAAAVAG